MIVPSSLYSVLTHPHRRTIIKEIYLEREGSIKHFKESLQFKTGTLYHHLKILINANLIIQNEDRKYLLTPLGEKLVIELLEERDLPIESSTTEIHAETVNPIVIKKLTIFEKIINQVFDRIYLNSNILLPINVIAIVFLVLNLVELRLGILGCFMFQTSEPFGSSISLLFSLFAISLLIWLIPRLFEKSEPFSLEFMILTTSLYLPISIVTGILRIGKMVPLVTDIQTPLLAAFQLVTQLFWIIWIYLVIRNIFLVEKKSALIVSFLLNYFLLSLTLIVL